MSCLLHLLQDRQPVLLRLHMRFGSAGPVAGTHKRRAAPCSAFAGYRRIPRARPVGTALRPCWRTFRLRAVARPPYPHHLHACGSSPALRSGWGDPLPPGGQGLFACLPACAVSRSLCSGSAQKALARPKGRGSGASPPKAFETSARGRPAGCAVGPLLGALRLRLPPACWAPVVGFPTRGLVPPAVRLPRKHPAAPCVSLEAPAEPARGAAEGDRPGAGHGRAGRPPSCRTHAGRGAPRSAFRIAHLMREAWLETQSQTTEGCGLNQRLDWDACVCSGGALHNSVVER